MKYAPIALILLGLTVYVLLFCGTELPTLEDRTGEVWRRIDFLFLLLFRTREMLPGGWFGTPPEFSLLDRLAVLLPATGILACALGLGWLLMAACRVQRELTRLETLVFSAAVGFNAISTYVLLAGLLGLLANPFVFTLPAVSIAAGAGWLFWKRLSGAKRSNAADRAGADSGSYRAAPKAKQLEKELQLSPHWLWLSLPFVLIIVLGGMLPPLDFDVLEYHLQAPKEFYQLGRITFLPHNVYGNMALGTEMISLLAMQIVGDWWLGALVGKTVIAAMTPLTALALLAAGRRFFSPTAGVVAALVYISIPWITSISSGGLVEGASAFYLLLAVYAVLLWQKADIALVRAPPTAENPSGRGCQFVLLVGYLAGGAVSCTYPAVLFVALPLAVWVSSLSVRFRTGKAPALFLLAVLVGCGVWFGKNWVMTGNPTYPLLYEVFDGKTRTAEKNEQWNSVHRPGDFSPSALGDDLAKVGLRSEWLSPLVMPLALLALLSPRRRRLVILLWVYFALVIAGWWLFTHRIDRFWIPVLSVAALLSGVGACWSRQRWWRVLVIVVLPIGLGANFLVAASGYNPYFVSLERLRRDPGRVDAWHRYFNRHPIGGRVLMVGDAAVFDLEISVLYNTCFDDCLFEQLAKGRTAEQLRAELGARHISHVYVHWDEIRRYRNTGYGFSEFVQPAVFERLTAQGVLEPLPAIKGHPGRGYRVKLKAESGKRKAEG